MAKLAVLVVHGMGTQPDDYADPMIDELNDRLRALGQNPDHVLWKAAHWSHVLDGRENDLYRRLAQNHDLDWGTLRRSLVLSGLGDAVAYQGPATAPSTVYEPIHRVLADALEALGKGFTDADMTPLVVMAHSLGGTIVSNYIWDAQRQPDRHPGRSPFTRCETLSGIITFGCNLPLFTLAIPPEHVTPITFPGAGAAAAFPGSTTAQREAALHWNNYFDPDDVLGYPLRPINAAYGRTVHEDREIQTGTILSAHTEYWTDNSFTVPVARQLERLLQLLG